MNKRMYPPAKQMLSLRLPPELIEEVRVAADQNRQTVTDYIMTAVKTRLSEQTEQPSASAAE